MINAINILRLASVRIYNLREITEKESNVHTEGGNLKLGLA